MGCAYSKPKVKESEGMTIDQLENELFRFEKNIRGYWRRKMTCLKRIQSAKNQTSTPSSRRFKDGKHEKDGSPTRDKNISNIKQDLDEPQREPTNAGNSHVAFNSQRTVHSIPGHQQTSQSLSWSQRFLSVFFHSQTYKSVQNYDVIRQIGAGAFGKVYLAEHKSKGEEMAIKTIPLGFSDTTRVMTEVEILRKCDHKNIIRLHESFCFNAHLCMVTEYVPGGDLHTISSMAQGFLINEGLVSHVMRECLQGLAYLHHRKIIHCDFKSANILVGMNGQVKIADFGLSEREDKYIIPGFRGTTWYAAPEMAKELAFGKAIDIWGLGIVAIEMVQGYPPLKDAKTDKDALRMSKRGYNAMNKKAASKASKVFKDFLYGGTLKRNPAKRLTADELLHHPFIVSPVHYCHYCGDNCQCLSILLGWVKAQQKYGGGDG